jgi:hypothetical protein
VLIDYTQTGHKPAAGASRTHASHGLGGGDDSVSVQDDRPIVCVQLPVATTADTSGGTLSHQVMRALAYIVTSGIRLLQDRGLRPPPIVVNLSYGIFAGPHDGSGLLEAAIDDFIVAREAADKRPYGSCCHQATVTYRAVMPDLNQIRQEEEHRLASATGGPNGELG